MIEIEHDVLAGKMQRLGNCLIDSIVIAVITSLVFVAAGLLYRFSGDDRLLLWLAEMNGFEAFALVAIINTAYYVFFEWATAGRTIGKYATSNRVLRPDGQKLTIVDVLLRSLIRLVPFEALTFIGEFSNGWHDSISKTAVVNIYKYEMAVRINRQRAEMEKA